MRLGQRHIGRLVVVAVAAWLGGCSQLPSYPSLPIGDVIGQKTLTPEQRDAEIKELSDAQAENTAQATPTAKQPEVIPASVTKTE